MCNIIPVKHNFSPLTFLNRHKEIDRLNKALTGSDPKLIVIYGRRRCGKSTLIRQVLKPGDVYFLAQQTDPVLQRARLADAISAIIPGFEKVSYPDWESLFVNLRNASRNMFTLCLDEFPWLVKSDPALPDVLQQICDEAGQRKFHIILCGSSQQMMQGLVLDSTAPLYGRAHEMMKITPLEAGWIQDALQCSPEQAVTEYAVWGGIPRYWELRKEEDSTETAIKNIILDRHGVLHEEPMRLFLDDMRESVQAFSLLSLIGTGSCRLTEIAARLGKPASQLSRPLDNLIRLGYVRREIPYGEKEKNSKKSLYKIADPFMRFYFAFVVPDFSRLEMNLTEQVFDQIKGRLTGFVSEEWENLCRKSIPLQPVSGISFNLARRYWGHGINGQPVEVDIVAESSDKQTLLIGECKWSDQINVRETMNELNKKIALLPFAQNKTIIPALFLKKKSDLPGITLFTPEEIITRLKI